jgi:RNA-directed DNA polymerase
VNTGEPSWPDPLEAERRVLRMQAKLHLWATEDPGRRFDDLFNLVCHPDFLTVAWERVRGNKGARTAGVDRVIPAFITDDADIVAFLSETRRQLKSRTFAPLPVRERMIPKAGQPGKFRRLGIPSAMDRLVQASLVLVLEPIFEADFKPVSYGFRPKRRAQDAIAEIHYFGSRSYHWVFEADITACFDELSHSAILDRVRRRVADKRVLALIKTFLKAGIMSEAGQVTRRCSSTSGPRSSRLGPGSGTGKATSSSADRAAPRSALLWTAPADPGSRSEAERGHALGEDVAVHPGVVGAGLLGTEVHRVVVDVVHPVVVEPHVVTEHVHVMAVEDHAVMNADP